MAEFELSLPPFLKSQLLAGRVIPFLGAGISRNAGLPDWQGLLERLVDWSTVNGIPINSPDVLKAIKAQEFEPAAHELEILGDRLIEALTQILTANSAQPTKVHRIIASVIWPAIITTNFDSLLPQSCSDLKVCTWNEHQEIGTILKMGNPHLMMLHGWISRPSSIVLAPRAYRESVRNPALQVYMRNMLSQHTFVFMGFSMKDQDLELYLADQQFALDKADLPHFALLPESEATSLKQRHLRDNYGIQVITYNPSCSAHPEVEFFAKLLVDHIPQQYLHDPKSRIRDLNDIRVAQAQLSPSEYYKRFREACQRLADSGFLRTAWTSLQSELRNQTDTIPIAERFEFMIVATEMRLLDDATSLAFYELREMIPLLNNSELEDKLKLRFENVLFKVCLNEYQLAEAQSCVARVEQMKCGEVEVARMSSLLVLANFLHTDDTIPTVNISGHYEIAATAESMAMRGEFESAQVYLRCKAESFAELTVSCWLFMKQAELHFVDGRHFEALEILDTKGFPSIATLPREQRIALENNRSFLHILVGKQDATRDFNSAVDQARDSREANHLRQLVRAEQASLEKKHYDSLPILWRDLLQNYFDGDWNGRKSAHARFASEAFAAEWILPATHHAILGDADKLLVRIAQRLSSSPQPEQLDQVVSYLLKNCHLTQHAMTAAKMLQHLGDVIPDSRIAELVDRVDQMLARPEITRADKVAIEGALELIEHVAFRLSQDEAIRLIRRVMNHCSMTAVGWSRLARVKSLSAMVDYVRAFDWRSFAISILPLAKEQRYEGDLENVLFLLEQVAERDSSAQALIADTLIPSGIPQTNHQMQELGLKLGRRMERGSSASFFPNLAAKLKEQVRCSSGEAPPIHLSHTLSISKSLPNGNTLRVVIGGDSELHWISLFHDLMTPEELSSIFDLVIELIANPRNLRVNRTQLLRFIIRLRAKLSKDQIAALLGCCFLYADENAPISPAEQDSSSTTDRIKIKFTTLAEQQAYAFVATVILSGQMLEFDPEERSKMVEAAFLSPKESMRAAACEAIAHITAPTEQALYLLLTATQDHGILVSTRALVTTMELCKRGALESHRKLLVAILERSIGSVHPQIRRLTAQLAAALSVHPSDEHEKTAIDSILNKTMADTHFTVRTANAKPLRADSSSTRTESSPHDLPTLHATKQPITDTQ